VSPGFPLPGVVSAVSIAVLAYLGFDAIATFAEENTGPTRLIGRATLVCLAIAGVLFFAQTYLVALLSPTSPEQFTAHPELQGTAYYDIVRTSIIPWLATALALAKAIAAAFSGMIGQPAGGRIALTMARDGRLPRSMRAVSRRTGIPTVATVSVTAITFVVAIWAARAADGLDQLVSIVNVGALCAFVLLHASVVGFFVVRQRSKAYGVHLVVPVLGVATILPVLVLANHRAQLLGAVWLGVGLVTVALQRHHRNNLPPTASAGGAGKATVGIPLR
jgi:amino acid transporter